eukprot:3488010-Prymnesium_polylepis.1
MIPCETPSVIVPTNAMSHRTKSERFTRHRRMGSLRSIRLLTAATTTAARLNLGRKRKSGVSATTTTSTISALTRPASCEAAPAALLTADREKEPVAA